MVTLIGMYDKPENLDGQTSLGWAEIWGIFRGEKSVKSSSSWPMERSPDEGPRWEETYVVSGCRLWYSGLDPGFFTPLVANEEEDGRETHGRDKIVLGIQQRREKLLHRFISS